MTSLTNHPLRFGLVAAALVLGAPAVASAADQHKIDVTHSSIIFKVKHFNFSYVYGRFRSFSGSFNLDDKSPNKSSVKIEVDASSVYTAEKKRDAHLRNPDFFNVKLYPKIKFVSTKVKRRGKAWYVTGNLTLHGVTKPVTAKMAFVGSGKDPWGNYRSGFTGSMKIKRSQFGMTNVMGPAGDDIELMLAFEGIKQ